jgi:hypothetical protein
MKFFTLSIFSLALSLPALANTFTNLSPLLISLDKNHGALAAVNNFVDAFVVPYKPATRLHLAGVISDLDRKVTTLDVSFELDQLEGGDKVFCGAQVSFSDGEYKVIDSSCEM